MRVRGVFSLDRDDGVRTAGRIFPFLPGIVTSNACPVLLTARSRGDIPATTPAITTVLFEEYFFLVTRGVSESAHKAAAVEP